MLVRRSREPDRVSPRRQCHHRSAPMLLIRPRLNLVNLHISLRLVSFGGIHDLALCQGLVADHLRDEAIKGHATRRKGICRSLQYTDSHLVPIMALTFERLMS